MSDIQSLPTYRLSFPPVKEEFAGYKMSIHLLLKPMNLTRISHEPERCRSKAFQPEDVEFYFEG
ncbi:MAG: hypothetical protein V3S72_01380 [Desulfobacterales bacterium]